MKKYIYTCLLYMACLLTGCIEEFNAHLPYSDMDLLVVDGNITANSDVVFNLSKTFSLSEENLPDGYNDIKATLCVVGSDGYRSAVGVEIDKGKYQISVGELKNDATYWIEIVYDGNTYQSTPQKPLYTPPVDSVSFKQIGYGDIDFMVSTHNPTSGKEYYLWTFEEDWEITSYYYVIDFYDEDTNSFYKTERAPYYYCWGNDVSHSILLGSTEALSENRIVNQKIFTINPYSERVKTLYCMTLKQRTISRAAYDFYSNKLKQNEEMGGLFTPQPSELPSNITCVTNQSKKVLGFVEVSSNISTYRKFVTSREIKIPAFAHCQDIDFSKGQYAGLKTAAEIYGAGLRPVFIDPEGVIDWREAECADCRLRGGGKVKPSFWPNNHE